jgi:hypothetical protein
LGRFQLGLRDQKRRRTSATTCCAAGATSGAGGAGSAAAGATGEAWVAGLTSGCLSISGSW